MEHPVSFESDGLRLEGLLGEGKSGGASAVILHPHPSYGGDMYSPVVAALTAALGDRGMTTLRFNFRGAGGSSGEFSGGPGEAEDAMAAVAYMRKEHAGPLLLCGYSFGGTIVARVATRAAPAAAVLVSPVLDAVPRSALPRDTPALLIAGERDEYCDPDVLRTFVATQHRVVILPGVDHYWNGALYSLSDEVARYLDDVMP